MRHLLIAAVFFVLAFVPASMAYAVFVTPVTVTFEPGQSTARITLNNRSNETKVMTFSWERRILDGNGKSIVLKDGDPVPPSYKPLDPYVKFSPRRVILKPRQRQTIRLIAQRPQGMAAGEYRSHFLITEEGLLERKMEAGDTTKKGVAGKVFVNLNKSVPVFLRSGETSVNVVLHSAKRTKNQHGDAVVISLSNDSTRSVYAHVHLTCPGEEISPANRSIPLRLYAEVKDVNRTYVLAPEKVKTCAGVLASVVATNDEGVGGEILSQQPLQ